MAIVVIDENSEEGRDLIDFLRNKTYARIVNGEDEFPAMVSEPDVVYGNTIATIHPTNEISEEDIPFERIPGLPYTHEERLESLRRAEEDIAAGRTTTHDEVMARMRERIKSWK